MDPGRFWRIAFHSANPDEIAAYFIAQGAAGVEITGSNSFECYIEGDISELDAVINKAARLGITFAGAEKVTAANWCAQCTELWEITKAGTLTIRPVQSEQGIENDAKDPDLFIIPGLGFGTGHHASTRQALILMQEEVIKARPPRTMLDIGTGSGILAVAAAKLYGTSAVGFDIDPHAVISARDNCRINRSRNISLFTGELEAVEKNVRFDLVTANLYAELLIALAEDISPFTSGWLILSGIQSSLAEDVIEEYIRKGLIIDVRISDGEWDAFLVRTPEKR